MSPHLLSDYASYALSGHIHVILLWIHLFSRVVLKDLVFTLSFTEHYRLSLIHSTTSKLFTQVHTNMSSSSTATHSIAQLSALFDTIENSENLLNLLATAGDPVSQKFFTDTLLKAHPGVFEGLKDEPSFHFRALLGWFGV